MPFSDLPEACTLSYIVFSTPLHSKITRGHSKISQGHSKISRGHCCDAPPLPARGKNVHNDRTKIFLPTHSMKCIRHICGVQFPQVLTYRTVKTTYPEDVPIQAFRHCIPLRNLSLGTIPRVGNDLYY